MKALIIGGSGMVGGALCRTLERSGVPVAVTYYSRSVDGATRLDVRDAAEVRGAVEAVAPDVIFLAVNTRGGVDACEVDTTQTVRLDLNGARNVAEAAARSRAKLVYYSSDYIFDGKSGPYSEEDHPNPISAYGRSKWEAELIVSQLVPDHLIIRTTCVFGWDRTSRNFAMQVWENLQVGKSMRVPCDQWGNPTLSDYLAEVSVRLVQMDVRGVINVVGSERMPRSELGRILARTMALDPGLIVPLPTSEMGQKARRPLQGGLKTDKLLRCLGTEPFSLTESLKPFRRQWRAETYSGHGPTCGSTEAEALKKEILEKVTQYHELAHQPRPFVPFKSRLQYAGRVYGPEEMVNLVDSALDFWLTLGPYGDLLEHKMKQFLGVQDFAVMNSGSTANLCAVMTLMSEQLERPLRAGDEVITPAVTFPTTLAPVVHGGLIPVFVDCEVGTYNINPHLIEEAISEKTRAIMIPHTLGNPCDMDLICDLAKRYSLYLVEDACDALGGTFSGRLLGTFGDLATLSFFPAHHMTLGEGGAVLSNNARLARIVRSVRDWGRDCWCAPGESNTCAKRFGWQLGGLPAGYDHKYTYSNLGYNFKPTDLQAAIGVAQVDRLSSFIELRRHNFSRLYRGLQDCTDQLILPTLDPRSNPAWFGFPITLREGRSRRELVYRLENAGIETREVFAGNILKQPGYRNIRCRISGGLEQTDYIMHNTFFVGLYPGLNDEMITFMIEQIHAAI